MRAVAERAIAAVLAAAEIDGAILLGCVGSRRKISSFVRAITEWLRGTFTAGAPVVGLACFNFDGNRGFLSNDGFGHRSGIWG